MGILSTRVWNTESINVHMADARASIKMSLRNCVTAAEVTVKGIVVLMLLGIRKNSPAQLSSTLSHSEVIRATLL